MTRKKIISNIFFYLFATFVAVIAMIPFIWMVITSLKTSGALLAVPVEWIPKEPTLQAYIDVFRMFPFARTIFNSLFLAITMTIVCVISASMAAFAFAKLPFKGSKTLFKILLISMMIPFQALFIPLFIIMKELHLTNKFIGIILPYIFNVFSMFMIHQQMKAVSSDYIDAAVIDGANYFTIFFKIMLPLVSATVATLSVITFMGAWNSYLWPLIMLTDRTKLTLPVALGRLNGQYGSDYNMLMAASLISIIPIIIIYILAQRYMKSGLQVGGIKG